MNPENPLHHSLNDDNLHPLPENAKAMGLSTVKRSYMPIILLYGLYTVVYSLVIPALPALALEVTNKDSSQSSYLYGLCNCVRYIVEFLAAPFLGTCTDVFGRKTMLAVTFFINAVEFFLLAALPSIPMLLITRVMSGLLDSGIPTAFTIITDLALYNHDDITTKFGLAAGILGAGFIIGPIVGGVLVGISIQLCFLVAAVLAVVGLLCTTFFFQETVTLIALFQLKPNLIRSFKDVTWTELNPIPPLVLHFRNKSMRNLLIPLAVGNFPLGVGAIWYIYMDYRFNASSTQVGIFLSYYGILAALVQTFLVKKVIPAMYSELEVAIYGGITSAMLFAGLGFIPVFWGLFIPITVLAPGLLCEPALKGLIVKESLKHPDGVNLQGNLQGVICSIRTLALGFGSLIFAAIFAESVKFNPVMPYLAWIVGAFMYLLGSLYLFIFIDKSVGGEEGVSRSVSRVEVTIGGEFLAVSTSSLYQPVRMIDDEEVEHEK